ncbi:MAG: hypothetical protein IJ043_09955 [Clostridia bacterium]|nr:hypothetical protein [Clostridia bacterium]
MNEQEFLVQKLRTQYTEKEYTNLELLKELDAKVKRPANFFAYLFGSIGAIVMGSGMSLVMTEELRAALQIAEPLVPGIVIGCIGLVMAVLNYPLYKGILGRRRKKYADQIISLSDSLLSE